MKNKIKYISRILCSLLLVVSIFGIYKAKAEDAIFKLTNISVKEKSNKVSVIDVSLSGGNIKNDVVFTDKDDYIKYNITIKNNSDNDYTIKSISDNNSSPNLEYTYNGLSNVKVEAGKEKTFELQIKYVQETNDLTITDKSVSLTITYEKVDGTIAQETITNDNNTTSIKTSSEKVNNPKTGDGVTKYIILGIISFTGLVITTVNKKHLSKSLMVIALVSIVSIPLGVKADSDKFIIVMENEIKDAEYNVTFKSNGGKFADGTTSYVIPYRKSAGPTGIKVSHTENVDDTGKKTEDYEEYWGNVNIVGTDRGDTDKAHVVTLDGANQIIVDIYYNGENSDYDWACVWEGSHPDYDCENDYSETINGEKLGGEHDGTYGVNGNELTNMGHKKYVIDGDSVTFGFVSDSSICGDGYGYYATVKANIEIDVMDTIPTPTIDQDLVFNGWCTETVCNEGNKINPNEITENMTVYAYWAKKESTLNKNKFRDYTKVQDTNGYIPQTKIKHATLEEFNQVKDTLTSSNIVSTDNSVVPTYCWKTDDTIYYYSEGIIYLPADSSCLFWLFRYVEEIDVSGFDTSRVTSMEMMFSQLEKVKKLDLSTFDTSNVINMRQMFGITDKLEELDLSSFDTRNVTNMGSMFGSMKGIKTLDISNFDTSNVENFVEMFGYDDALETIYVSDKFVVNTTDSNKIRRMFMYSRKLKGGKGTTYDESNVTSLYARIDDPTNGKPGYFTDIKDKPQP